MSHANELNCLWIPNVREKLKSLPFNIEEAWKNKNEAFQVPDAPGRDLPVLERGRRGERRGFSHPEGQARLLHDLASIELQAMELAYRSFVEFPNAPSEFREQMAELALSESEHLTLCLDRLEEYGFQWGHWPVYLSLWNSVSREDSLLDRLLIVHRYLEASGLDAGVSLLRKLAQSHSPALTQVVKKITEEEVDHVAFGSRWYQFFCREQRLDADHDFKQRLSVLSVQLPKRFEVIDPQVRQRAGFTEAEVKAAQELREQFLQEKKSSI